MSAKKKVAAKKSTRKPAAKKKVAKRKSPAKKAAAKKKAGEQKVAAEKRYKMIQDAAYFLAEKSGFTGNTLDHWTRAEKQIDARLKGK